MIPCSLQQARDVVNGLPVVFVVLKKEGEFADMISYGKILGVAKEFPESETAQKWKPVYRVGSPVAIGDGKIEYVYCPKCKTPFLKHEKECYFCSYLGHKVINEPVLPIVLRIEQKKLNEINGEEAIRAGYPKPRVNKDNPFLGHGGDALNSLKWNIHVDNGLKFENGQFLNPEVFVIEVRK